jgi:DNA-binding MarR family transcriptional regulator/GNAT superfamily N-acetyltransferase
VNDSQIASIRGFHRTVTERAGVLEEEYLSRGRPLGASRVLWEVGPDGEDARSLRNRLDLDSGYLSRILRILEADGLIETSPSIDDGRVRIVSLTKKGVLEKALLDRLSDELAASILEPLNETQREHLVTAAATVERLLTAGLVELRVEHPGSNTSRFCLDNYFAELDERFETGFDATLSNPAATADLLEPAGLFLVAWLRGRPIGCGALKFHSDAPSEVKRMWVDTRSRGLGVGRRILSGLEDHARRRGVGALRLETNHLLAEAIGLYRSHGYKEVTPFNDEPFAHHWFEKTIS